MIITQAQLIKKIAEQEDTDVKTVDRIFKAAERFIFESMSATTALEKTVVKLLDGLSLECTYVPERSLNTFEELHCQARLRVKAKVTRHYNRKLNGYF